MIYFVLPRSQFGYTPSAASSVGFKTAGPAYSGKMVLVNMAGARLFCTLGKPNYVCHLPPNPTTKKIKPWSVAYLED